MPVSKDTLINTIARIDEQLAENKKILEPYLGREIEYIPKVAYLIDLTKRLKVERDICNRSLMYNYGMCVM